MVRFMLHRGSSLSQTRNFLSVRLMVVRAGVQSVAASRLRSRMVSLVSRTRRVQYCTVRV